LLLGADVVGGGVMTMNMTRVQTESAEEK